MWELQQYIEAFDAERFTTLGPGYLALNLAGEAGELANVVKKLWRLHPGVAQPDGFAEIPEDSKTQLGDELADVLITAIVLANHLHIDVEAEIRRKLATIDERVKAGYYGGEAKA